MPPTFATMVPELLVTNLDQSLHFWTRLCGFTIAYDRPEDRFAYLDRAGVQVMLEEAAAPGRRWMVGALEHPFGRGINLQMTVEAIDPIVEALRQANWPLYLAPEEKWYRAGSREVGVRQVVVQDPDGYLLRFSQPLGNRIKPPSVP